MTFCERIDTPLSLGEQTNTPTGHLVDRCDTSSLPVRIVALREETFYHLGGSTRNKFGKTSLHKGCLAAIYLISKLLSGPETLELESSGLNIRCTGCIPMPATSSAAMANSSRYVRQDARTCRSCVDTQRYNQEPKIDARDGSVEICTVKHWDVQHMRRRESACFRVPFKVKTGWSAVLTSMVPPKFNNIGKADSPCQRLSRSDCFG